MMHVSATLEYTTLLYRMVQPECMHSRRYPSRVPRKTKPRERKMRSQHFTLNTSLPHLLTNSCTKSPKPDTLLRLLVQLPNFLACAVVPTMTPKSWHFGCASMRTYKHANILNNARAYRTRTQRCGASIRTWDRSQQCQLARKHACQGTPSSCKSVRIEPEPSNAVLQSEHATFSTMLTSVTACVQGAPRSCKNVPNPEMR